MCYIIAYAGSKPLAKDKIAALITEAEHSGGQGIGIVWNTARGREKTFKTLVPLASCYDEILKHLSRATTFLYHSRMATAGNHTLENLHPFEKSGCAVAHNGHLYDQIRTIDESDTAAFIRLSFRADKPEKTCKKFAARGYGSLVWKQGGQLRAFKSNQSLSLVRLPTGYILASRNIPFGVSEPLEDDILYSLTAKSGLHTLAHIPVRKYAPEIGFRAAPWTTWELEDTNDMPDYAKWNKKTAVADQLATKQAARLTGYTDDDPPETPDVETAQRWRAHELKDAEIRLLA